MAPITLKLHQREMAKKMGISRRVYRRYENGEQIPGSDKLMLLCEDLSDLNPAWLLMGTGRMFKSPEKLRLKEAVLETVSSSPLVERIVLMLRGLDDEDLEKLFTPCWRKEENEGSSG